MIKGFFYVSHTGFLWWSDYELEPAEYLQNVNTELTLGPDMFKMIFPEAKVDAEFFENGLYDLSGRSGFLMWDTEWGCWSDQSYR